MRGVATRRSLDQNAPERKSGRQAFKNARSLFEKRPGERGDEEYGETIYSLSNMVKEDDERTDDSSNSKSINDLIKNFEALSTPVNRGRNFGSARVTRSASPVKWRRKSAPASSFDSEDSVPTIPAEPPRSTRRGRPSIEYQELETTLNTTFEKRLGDDLTSQSSYEDRNQNENHVTKRTDMTRLSDPTLPHSFIASLPNELNSEIPPTRSRLRWSEKPIMVGETYHKEDYERGNPDLDPVAESAVYELEKRLDKMDKFELILEKDSNGYGLSIIGMGIGADAGVERLGIYVKKVFPGQAAEKVGIQMADQIVEVDGTSLVGVSHSFAADTLRSTDQRVRFLMARDRDQETSEVRKLIVDQLEHDQRVESSPEPSDEEDMQNGTFEVDYNDDDPQNARLMQDAQNRLLHELSLRDNEIRTKDKELANLRSELAHMREELDRLTLKNQELEKTNQQLESRWMVENMSFDQNKANSRTRIPTLDSNLDELDDLEESRVDDSILATWTADDVLNWLKQTNQETLVPLFKIHKIDGKELDRIREKNDSKMLKQLGVQKEQRAQLRTALRSLTSSTC